MTPPDPCTTHSEQRLTHPCEAGKTISKGFGIAVLPSGHVELHVTDGFDAALRICTSAADPRGTLNFTLAADSPAYRLGFQRIPMECFGPLRRCPGEPDYGARERDISAAAFLNS